MRRWASCPPAFRASCAPSRSTHGDEDLFGKLSLRGGPLRGGDRLLRGHEPLQLLGLREGAVVVRARPSRPGAAALGGGRADRVQWAPKGRESHLHYRFCKTCGIRTFGRGYDLDDPRAFYFVNVAALDGVPPADLEAGPLRYVDGRSDRYDQTPAHTELI